MRACSIEGCARPHLARGWCAAHYERWSKYGDPLGGGPRRHPRAQVECQAEGCRSIVKTNGWCPKHYQRVRLHGSPDEHRRPACRIPGCSTPATGTGLCQGHRLRQVHWGDPTQRPTCSAAGCDRPARHSVVGLCQMHYHRLRRHGVIGTSAPQRFTPPRAAKPGHKWCGLCREELPRAAFFRSGTSPDGLFYRCRECHAGAKRARDYGLPIARYVAMLEKQGHACAICRQPETAYSQHGTIRRLSVDHDHRCCPGKKSCGKCVRALLCTRCNTVIGLVQENTEILGALERYLNSLEAQRASRGPADDAALPLASSSRPAARS